MDFELFSESAEDDYAFGDEYINNEHLAFEGDEDQRCGICMDVVVDRGVLDCCQHWYCFSCIDNWASITNLCPLCQNEFQLITCVPVYDTIGSTQPDDGSYSRDDDWSVDGKNNSLSFPSYYIDENAVSCLEGDSCKLRGQPANLEEDPDLDTSIACDSCDLWYHAICVGFDPNGSCETSWLCPRCSADEKSEIGPSNRNGLENSSHEHLMDATFPKNVSVSVADAGETAVVVSIINGHEKTKVPPSEDMSSVNMSNHLKNGNQENEEMNQIMVSGSDFCEDKVIDKTSNDDNCTSETQLAEKVIKKPKVEAVEFDFKEETSVFDGLRTSESYDDFCNNNSHVGPSSDKHETTEELEEKNVSEECRLPDKHETTEGLEEKNVSEECRPPADKNSEKKEKVSGVTGAKRKLRDRSVAEEETKAKIQNSVSTKIVKADRRSRINESVPENPKNLNNAVSSISRKRKVETDIRDIVQGTYQRPSKKLAEDKETSSGLRIKKIMRRSSDDKESLAVVQNLRKEIRDAIRNRSSKEIGDNLFDPKLLTAFRAALAVQTTESNRPQPLDVKAKKALLQKGSVRENLTKKIYGIGGKRKRAWTRDCEIEFWKHRCAKVSKPEKIETLKSVLDLLRKGPQATEIKKESTVNAPTSILSRLYVADASVFPRKADIKPLSAVKAPDVNEASVKPTDFLVNNSKETKVAIPPKKGEPATRKVIPNKSVGSSLNAQKESSIGSNNNKFDKKKWALEVLARKTAVAGNNSSQGQDNAALKGNYPLLAKLPVEMRPSLAPSRHNKIPISVRQAQLYRLTEHFLKKTNMPVTRPTAEIELAVADAINVEKAVADRSNSKLVYVNLCSQELKHRSDNIDSTTTPDSEKPPPVVDDTSETKTETLNMSADVDEALKNAGLLSDSPPDSPLNETEDVKEEDGPDNVFEIDSNQELDIYGDFEYDLEDDDFIGVSAIKTTSKIQQDDSKMKMVFSTLDSNKSDNTWQFEDHEVAENENEDKSKENEEEVGDELEELYGPDKEPLIIKYPEIKLPDLVTENNVSEVKNDKDSNIAAISESELPNGSSSEKIPDLPNKILETVDTKEKKSHVDKKQQSDKDKRSSVFKKVEAYIKEHIRPLCKSGVITVDQYRWAVGKTTDKIMKYHSKDTNANFLIKEGEKVKKLAEQYVETAQKVEK